VTEKESSWIFVCFFVIRHSFLGINEEGESKGLYRERLNNNTKQLYLDKLLDINNMDP